MKQRRGVGVLAVYGKMPPSTGLLIGPLAERFPHSMTICRLNRKRLAAFFHPISEHLFVLLLGAALFFLQGPPYVLRPMSRLPDDGDSLLNSWILAWDAHAVFHRAASIWDAPIFYPIKGALAFSETMFGDLWISMPVQWITGNPTFAFNVLLIASFVLCAYCTFLLAKDLTGDYWAGLMAGILFAFNPYRWIQACHVQLEPFFWAPLAILFACRFMRNRASVSFWGMLACVWAQYYASIYLGTMLVTLLLALFSLEIILERSGVDRLVYFSTAASRMMIFSGLVLSILILLPLALPYIRAAKYWHFVRTITENEYYSAEPFSFFLPGNFRSYRSLEKMLVGHVQSGEAAVFPGLLPVFLAIYGWIKLRRHGDDRARLFQRFALAAILMAVMMLGPTLMFFKHSTGFPLPYRFFYYFMPGAKAIRVPSRFFQPFLLCLSVAASFGASAMMESWRKAPASIKAVPLLAVLLFEPVDYAVGFRAAGAIADPFHMPPVYSYLAKTKSDHAVLELPVGEGFLPSYWYQFYQTAHWHPMLGGFSGFVPPQRLNLSEAVDGFPSKGRLRYIAGCGADTVIIHLRLIPDAWKKAWEQADLAPLGFVFIAKMGDDLVWERSGIQSATGL